MNFFLCPTLRWNLIASHKKNNNSAHGKHTSRHKTPTHTGHLGTGPRNKFKFFVCVVVVAFDFRHVVNITIIISLAISCSLLWAATTTLSTIGTIKLTWAQLRRSFHKLYDYFSSSSSSFSVGIIWNRARITTTEQNGTKLLSLNYMRPGEKQKSHIYFKLAFNAHVLSSQSAELTVSLMFRFFIVPIAQCNR